MTDRELLELAAKAAGLEVTAYDWQMGCRVIDGGVFKDWNPLTDDGDALRLAVNLGLSLTIQLGVYTIAANFNGRINEDVDHASDPYAATRRAIVRAAAEIGKGQS